MNFLEIYDIAFGKPKFGGTTKYLGRIHKLLDKDPAPATSITKKDKKLRSTTLDIAFLESKLGSTEAIVKLGNNEGYDIELISIYRGAYPIDNNKIATIQNTIRKFGEIHGLSIYIVKHGSEYILRCIYTPERDI